MIVPTGDSQRGSRWDEFETAPSELPPEWRAWSSTRMPSVAFFGGMRRFWLASKRPRSAFDHLFGCPIVFDE